MFEDVESPDIADPEAPPSKAPSGFADRIAARLLWWRWLEGERAKHPGLTTAEFDALTKDAREAKWTELKCGGHTKSKDEPPTEWQSSKKMMQAKPEKRGPKPKLKPPPTRVCIACRQTLPLTAFSARRSKKCTACLTEFHRQVVELREKGLSFRKIGQQLGASETSTHAAYHGVAG